MNRYRTTVSGLALAGALLSGAPGQALAGTGGELWGAATIEPGREGTVRVAGYTGPGLGAGSALTLTAPAPAVVTGTPLDARGYRGAVASGGRSATYTFGGTPADEPWRGRGFPFVLAVPADAVPGTRLTGCSMVLTDAAGVPRDRGSCAVTVGLPAPTLLRPQSGVPLTARPETSGTAYPGAQVTVRDALENEVCSTTAGADGDWSCVPAFPLAPGSGLLQATATLNGAGAVSDRIAVMVEGRLGDQPAHNEPNRPIG
ncbi:carboxypeptidase regulatory-like domain-containing protein [Streptomyces sp. YS415]|uniref:carboxypeptidase regulatory-like domain-containing protein n=1 Tax=Streptomyces sp. YS415 TaxID=2944806 RepID=UPI002020E8C5|nr:carboxypeptidase regulatory-like domain-containing protein [Streptomyces sp. YS415]MCL7428885.1 carboxypeptidase regulatory-like domain-containing protein [Streptomyces sp. YS415]